MSPPLPSVSVVIPIRNAGAHLPELLPLLRDQQGITLTEILLLDSRSTDDSRSIAEKFPEVRWLEVSRFSHGGTRNRGVEAARSEWVVLMTQDALPADGNFLRKLTAPLAEAEVAYTFARQIPRSDAPPLERHFLASRFPPSPSHRYASPNPRGPGEVFCSNVAAALRKSSWEPIRFDADLLMGEDQKFSLELQRAGLAVVYVPEAVVVHSHRYTPLQTLRRYFDSVVALRQIFPEHRLRDSAALGRKLTGGELGFLWRECPRALPMGLLQLSAKAAGTLLASVEGRLPTGWKRRLSLNPDYWSAPENVD